MSAGRYSAEGQPQGAVDERLLPGGAGIQNPGGVLVGRGSRKTQYYRDAADIDLWQVLLRHNTRRAVVYRGPRLGALIGLVHRFV